MTPGNVARIGLLAMLIPAGAVVSQGRLPSVSGIVVEMGTSKPLPHATIELQGNGLRLPALTDGAGQFVFKDVPPGQYRLTAALNGYLHAEYGRKTPSFGLATGRGAARGSGAAAVAAGIRGAAVSASPSLQVGAGRPVTDIRLAMLATAAISGRVFDAKGESFPYARVEALLVSYPDGERTGTLIGSTFTNDLGEYRLFGLPPGSYLIRADTRVPSQVYMPVAASITPPLPGGLVTQTASGGIGYAADPANQNNPLGNRGAARGGARGGQPTPEAPIVPIFFRSATNDRDATLVNVRPGDDTGGIDMVAAPITMVSVNASVSGAPTPNATLNVWPTPSDGARGGRGSAGSMQLSLPPGSYILSAAVNAPAARGAPSQPSRFAGYVALEANPYGPPQTVTVSVNPVLGVAGRIALDGGGATATDLARLSIQFRRTTRIPNIPNPTAVSPDAEGSFSALGFIDGEYLIEVAGFQGSLADAYVKSIRFAGVETADTGARIADQPAAALEISLARGASQLDGAATSGDGAVAADATIVLVPDRRNRRDLYKATISDASGRFHLDGVAPGAYRLFAWEEDLAFGSWFAAEFLRSVEDRGTPVVVGEGVRQNVEARVIPIR